MYLTQLSINFFDIFIRVTFHQTHEETNCVQVGGAKMRMHSTSSRYKFYWHYQRVEILNIFPNKQKRSEKSE